LAIQVTKSVRLKRLLEAGYLPEELPPPFVSHPIAKYRQSLLVDWTAQHGKQFQSFKSSPEPYSVPKFGHARRRVVIVNPINHFRVSKIIADNWVEIRNYLRQSKVSEFRPIFDTKGERATFGINWKGVKEAKVRLAARFARQFHTDISRFYGSIYTHSIAWAVHGKETVQKNLNASWFNKDFTNRLDVAVRHGQRNQSVGIPIGPDTSRIISEILAVGIEGQIKSTLPNLDERATRFVDDMIIGLDDDEAEEHIVSAVEGALSYFELDINFEKTKTFSNKTPEQDIWREELSAVRVGRKARYQREELDRFFGYAVQFAERSERDAVLKWAIKRSRSFRIADENYRYYVETLLRIARRAPTCLLALTQVLVDARHRGLTLPSGSVRKFAIDHLRVHGPVGHSFEVGWVLFLCKGLSISLKREEVEQLFFMRSSVCALLLMDLNARGMIEGSIDDRHWQTMCASADGLRSDMWLLAYEAVKKGWWTTPSHNYVSADPFFGPMLKRGVYFYDERRNVPTTRVDTKRAIERFRISMAIFSRWQEYF
jgi:hypothetical protein